MLELPELSKMLRDSAKPTSDLNESQPVHVVATAISGCIAEVHISSTMLVQKLKKALAGGLGYAVDFAQHMTLVLDGEVLESEQPVSNFTADGELSLLCVLKTPDDTWLKDFGMLYLKQGGAFQKNWTETLKVESVKTADVNISFALRPTVLGEGIVQYVQTRTMVLGAINTRGVPEETPIELVDAMHGTYSYMGQGLLKFEWINRAQRERKRLGTMKSQSMGWRVLERQAGPKALKLSECTFSSDYTTIAHVLERLPPLFWKTPWANCCDSVRKHLATAVATHDLAVFTSALGLARGLLDTEECLKAEQAFERVAKEQLAAALKKDDIDELSYALKSMQEAGLPEDDAVRQASKRIVALRLRRLHDAAVSSQSADSKAENDSEALHRCLKTLRSYVANVAQHPSEQRFRRIRRTNHTFETAVAVFEDAVQLLVDCGFEIDADHLTLTSTPNCPLLWASVAYFDVLLQNRH